MISSGSEKPISLKRVEELTGKTVAFHHVDIADTPALHLVFDQVSLTLEKKT